jgi:hypothetical protein
LKTDYDLDLFMETSAKTGFNAEELFIEASKLLIKDYNQLKKNKKKDAEKEKVKLDEAKNQKKTCC